MLESLSCPNCGAPLRQPKTGDAWVCLYCNSLVRVGADQLQTSLQASLDAAGMNEVKQLLVSGKRMQAIQRFRQLSGLTDEQAIAAVDQMAADFSIHTLYHQQLTPAGIAMLVASLALLPASLIAWRMGVLNPWLAAVSAIISGFGLFIYGRGGLITLRYWNAPIAPATTLHFTHIGAARAGGKRLHTFLILLAIIPLDGPPFQAQAIIPVREENFERVHQGAVIRVKDLPGKPGSVIYHGL